MGFVYSKYEHNTETKKIVEQSLTTGKRIKNSVNRIFIALFCLLISASAFAQKGIFKLGTVSPSSYVEEINYELVQDAIIVEVQINGKTYKFLLDTGAPTAINSNVIGDFTILDELEMTDASQNTGLITYVEIPKMQLGNLTYEHFAAMKHDTVFKSLGIDGILGGNLTCRSTWSFDLENKRILVSDKLDKSLVEDFKKTRVKILSTGAPTLTLTYFGKVKEKGIYFDTGFNGLFYLSIEMFEKLFENKFFSKMAEGSGILAEAGFGLEEASSTYAVKLSAQIGKHSVPNFISDVHDDKESNMGVEWLKYYHTVISGKDFYFKKNKTAIQQKLISRGGIEAYFDDEGISVSFVWKNTEAHKKGLKKGDRIFSVNKKDANKEDKIQLEELLELISNNEIASVLLEIGTKGNYVTLKNEVILDISEK